MQVLGFGVKFERANNNEKMIARGKLAITSFKMSHSRDLYDL